MAIESIQKFRLEFMVRGLCLYSEKTGAATQENHCKGTFIFEFKTF